MSSFRPDPVRSHERLIDHFKRVYSIVAGLALTDACGRTLPIDDPSDFRLWMFSAFFITIVPIFHGGDRSLDQKYLGRPPESRLGRLAFIWDDYMLLLTAVLFFCIADSIPAAEDGVKAYRFYRWMAAMFGFDVFVLAIDYCKNTAAEQELSPYAVWIPINILMCILCAWASLLPVVEQPVPAISIPNVGRTSLSGLSIGVFVAALARTILDYGAGEGFLFPRTATAVDRSAE